MDGEAFACLEKRGLGYLCGVSAGERYTNNIMERLTDDPLNGTYAGEIRDPRLSLMHSSCCTLTPLDNNVRVLCQLIDMNRQPLGAAHTLYENTLGGRVAIITPSPYHLMLSSAKIHQLYETFDWLAKGRMPLRMSRPGRIVPTVRVSEDRKHCLLMLLNGSMDMVDAPSMEIRLPVEGPWYSLDKNGQKHPLSVNCVRRTENGWDLTLDRLSMWEYRIILA